jgi:GTP cyclohydrolase IA
MSLEGKDKREEAIRMLLSTIPNEDMNREGLVGTPDRVARMYNEIFSGYEKNVEDLFKAKFDTDNDQMVIVKDIDYWSHCEHHMVPFFGKVHIAYIPGKKVLGLSKFGRLVEVFARRLQIQEQMTFQIADAIQKYLEPAGLMVVVEGMHMCMVMRGVKKANSTTITSYVKGAFQENAETRNEALTLFNL